MKASVRNKAISKSLRVAIILDQMGSIMSSYEEEVEGLVRDFSEMLFPAKLNVYKPMYVYPSEIKDGTDLILFDFGGMTMGNSLMEDNSRRLIEYARDHESTLCVVVSSFTWSCSIRYELESLELTGLPNLTCRFWMGDDRGPDDFDPIPLWFRQLHDLPQVPVYAPVKPRTLRKPKKT
jgi:hypothetical protein